MGVSFPTASSLRQPGLIEAFHERLARAVALAQLADALRNGFQSTIFCAHVREITEQVNRLFVFATAPGLEMLVDFLPDLFFALGDLLQVFLASGGLGPGLLLLPGHGMAVAGLMELAKRASFSVSRFAALAVACLPARLLLKLPLQLDAQMAPRVLHQPQ